MESDEDLERTCIDALIEASELAYFPLNWDHPVHRSPISSRFPRYSSALHRRKVAFLRPQRTDKALILPTMMTPWLRRTELVSPNSLQKRGLQRSKQRIETQSSSCIGKSPRRSKPKLVNISDFPGNLDRVLSGAISCRKSPQSTEMQKKKSVKLHKSPQGERGTHRDSERRLASPVVVRLAPFRPL